MIIKHLVSQEEYDAYIMQGRDYKPGHPTYCGCDPGMMCYEDRPYLAMAAGDWHHILSEKFANEFLLMEATEEEKKILIAEGYKMIGLGV